MGWSYTNIKVQTSHFANSDLQHDISLIYCTNENEFVFSINSLNGLYETEGKKSGNQILVSPVSPNLVEKADEGVTQNSRESDATESCGRSQGKHEKREENKAENKENK